MAKYYFNFTENIFKNPDVPKYIKARTCVECSSFAQVEELERNLRYKNKKAGYKMYSYPTWTYRPIKNACYMDYEDCLKFHDDIR